MYSVVIHSFETIIDLGISNAKTGDIIAIEQFDVDNDFTSNYLFHFLTDPEISKRLAFSAQNTIFSSTSNFSLVPAVFYDKAQLENMGGIFLEHPISGDYVSKFIPEIDSYLIFTFPKKLTHQLMAEIGPIDISHRFASLISTYHLYYIDIDQDMAFVHFHNKQFTLALFRAGKMILFNCFDINVFEDLIYYTYYALIQYQFSPDSTKIHFGGYSPFQSEIIDAFQRYTTHIYHLMPRNITDIDTGTSDRIISTIFDLQCG